ncbi:MAG: radical SAM protein [Dorea sp.]|nr:radical SAM protein [Dorea sp.]
MIFYDASNKEFLTKLTEGRKLICYGCGQEWKRAVKKLNLYPWLSYMIDNDKRKVEIRFPDDMIRQFSCYCSTELAKEIKSNEGQKYILLVTSIYWKQIVTDLKNQSVFEDIEIYIWPLMEVTGVSYEERYENRIINPAKKYYEKLLTFQGISPEKRSQMIEQKMRFMCEKGADGKLLNLVIPKIVFFLTTRCTLRCKECTALIPQFKNQVDIVVEQVIDDIEKVLEAVDEVIYVQLAGGESLLYPEFENILNYLIYHDKVLGITFVTNATITPSERILKLLENPKVYITISDYGNLDNLYNIVSLFEKREIAFELMPNMIWQKVGGTEYRNKELPQLKFEYLRCGNGMGCKMVENGYLHICDRSARMFMLNQFESTHDYTSLLCEVNERKERIRDIYMADYADACNHCDYANVDTEKIEPAEQIGKQLRKSAYTIVKR